MTSVKVETTDDVAVVTMANPPANLFNRELMAGLREVLRGAKLDGARDGNLTRRGPQYVRRGR